MRPVDNSSDSIKTSVQIWSGWQRLWGEPIHHTQLHDEIALDPTILNDSESWIISLVESQMALLLEPGLKFDDSKPESEKAHWSANETEWRVEFLTQNLPNEEIFKYQYRLHEIFERGNKIDRWRIAFSGLSAPLPMEPTSPFKPEDLEPIVDLENIAESFNNSLAHWPIEENIIANWGAVLWSAILFGGLQHTKGLAALHLGIINMDEEARWLMLTLVVKSKSTHENKHEEPPITYQRWLPHPLCRLMLLRWRDLYLSGPTQKNAYKTKKDCLFWRRQLKKRPAETLWKALTAWASLTGIETGQIKNISSLLKAVNTNLGFYLPQYLVRYAAGNVSTTCLDAERWKRLNNPPSKVLSTIPQCPDRNDDPSASAPAVIDENPDDNGELIELRRLINRCKNDNLTPKDTCLALKELLPNLTVKSVYCLVLWCTEWLLQARPGHKPLKLKTILDRLSVLGTWVVDQLGNLDPLTLDDYEEFYELYQLALEDTKSWHTRRRLITSIRSFNEWLVKKHNRPDLSDSGLLGLSSNGNLSVDANIVSSDVINNAEAYLNEILSTGVSDIANILISLGFEAGLRRSEATGLQIKDFSVSPTGKEVWLLVYKNKLRGLKNSNSKRHIPLHILMQPKSLKRLLKWYRLVEKRIQGAANVSTQRFFFFLDKNTKEELPITSNHKIFQQIRNALIKASHDPCIRFHNLRDSFASRLLLQIWKAQNQNITLPDWFMTGHNDRQLLKKSVNIHQQLLTFSDYSRRGIHQISQLLGHGSSEISFHSYLHLSDFLLGQSVKYLEPMLSNEVLKMLSGDANYSPNSRRIRNLSVNEKLEDIIHHLLVKTSTPNTSPNVKSKPKQKASRNIPNCQSPHNHNIDYVTPEKPDEFLNQTCTVINILLREELNIPHTKTITSNIEVNQKTKDKWLAEYKKLPHNFMRSTTATKGLSLIEGPQDKTQKALYQHTADKVAEKLGIFGAKSDISRSEKIRLIGSIKYFPDIWLNEPGFMLGIDDLSLAKNWLEIFRTLQIDDAIEITHQVSTQTKNPTPKQQYSYWKKNFPEITESKTISALWKTDKSRGGIIFEIKPKNIKIISVSKRPQLFGIRLALATILIRLNAE